MIINQGEVKTNAIHTQVGTNTDFVGMMNRVLNLNLQKLISV